MIEIVSWLRKISESLDKIAKALDSGKSTKTKKESKDK